MYHSCVPLPCFSAEMRLRSAFLQPSITSLLLPRRSTPPPLPPLLQIGTLTVAYTAGQQMTVHEVHAFQIKREKTLASILIARWG